MKISKLMGLKKSQYELDFYDFDVSRDTYKFFDPYYISKSDNVFLKECNEYITSFFNNFLYYLEHDCEAQALALFSHLGEMNEICLGMSKETPTGKGVGSIDAQKIFNAIKESAAFKNGTINTIADLRLFIKRIDRDKVSDMVANIIKKPLIEYTKTQCQLYNIGLTRSETGYFWDKTKWDRNLDDLLIIEGKVYFLYPRELITSAKYFSADEFFRNYILEYLQEKHLSENSYLVRETRDCHGKITNRRVFKKDIIEEIKQKGEVINKDWFSRFAKENPEVYRRFNRDVINKIKEDHIVINQEELNSVIDTLIMELNNIQLGGDNATKYHHLISGILELLFFSYIAHPKIEKEIHEGRKRIDIVFDNIAETGFFFLLGTTYNVPCSQIMIECKNYSKDIKNPELDQMSGRFSARRGKFGIICCRKIEDKTNLINSEKDTFQDDRGLVFHLDDADIIKLLTDKKNGIKPDRFFIDKYFEIIS